MTFSPQFLRLFTNLLDSEMAFIKSLLGSAQKCLPPFILSFNILNVSTN
ncbi:hypothetical protein LEQ41_07225 [Streptococcus agalactiae]|nr:hypothetical protein [Streptococcus agalactiae]